MTESMGDERTCGKIRYVIEPQYELLGFKVRVFATLMDMDPFNSVQDSSDIKLWFIPADRNYF